MGSWGPFLTLEIINSHGLEGKEKQDSWRCYKSETLPPPYQEEGKALHHPLYSPVPSFTPWFGQG